MNTDSNMIDRNIAHSFEFARAIVDDPSILDEIPNGATLVLLPDDDPDLFRENLRLGVEAAERGDDVYIRHVRHARQLERPQ